MKTHTQIWQRISWRLLGSGLLLALVALLATALNFSLVSAQGPGTPRDTDPFWQASYWNNTTLSGTPVLSREDRTLDFNWAYDSPDGRVQPDGFSARWQRYIDVTPGTYRFTAIADDGVRVRVDGRLIIDGWKQQGPTRYDGTIALSAGHHLVQVEYFEQTGSASISVSWQQAEAITHWKGEYFNNKSLSGTPVVVRNDTAIDFNWRYLSPAPGLDPDGFSVRWSQNLDLPAGRYRFTARVDDGVRLFVNGHTLIDAWKVQAVTAHSGDIYLPGGPVTVQMEYFEDTELAEAHLSWQKLDSPPAPSPTPTPTPVPTSGNWHAQYWNNRFLSGYPALVRREEVIDHQWGTLSPDPGQINRDNFSARWTGSFAVEPGRYVFEVTADDGVRLYVNDRRVIDAWQDQGPTTFTAIVQHNGGPIRILLEYYEHTGNAQVRLDWRPTGGPAPTPTPTPTLQPAPGGSAVLVDELSSSFRRGGSASGWGQAQEGYNGHLYWAQNNDTAHAGYNWGRWYPSLREGRYEVFVYIPHRYTTTAKARYWISHAGGFTLRVVDQSRYSNEWVSLGTYRFRGNERDYVSLADVTGEPRLSRLLAWDAMKWVAK